MRVRVDQQVFRFDVSMYNIISVTELNGFEQLINIFANSLRHQSIGPFLQYLEQVLLQVFKHQMQLVFTSNVRA